MEKVEAYRCEECEGKSRVMGEKTVISKGLGGIETSSKYPMLVDCPYCNGTGVVWLTEEEAREFKAKEITKEEVERAQSHRPWVRKGEEWEQLKDHNSKLEEDRREQIRRRQRVESLLIDSNLKILKAKEGLEKMEELADDKFEIDESICALKDIEKVIKQTLKDIGEK